MPSPFFSLTIAENMCYTLKTGESVDSLRGRCDLRPLT